MHPTQSTFSSFAMCVRLTLMLPDYGLYCIIAVNLLRASMGILESARSSFGIVEAESGLGKDVTDEFSSYVWL